MVLVIYLVEWCTIWAWNFEPTRVLLSRGSGGLAAVSVSLFSGVWRWQQKYTRQMGNEVGI